MRSRHVLASHLFSIPSLGLGFWVGVGGVVVGTAAGMLAGINSVLLGTALGAVIVLVYFFADFEKAALGLLILRSSFDNYSEQQLPTVLSLGIDALTLLYVTVLLLRRRTVHTDWFWWFFAGWLMLQGLWPMLSVFGELGPLNIDVLPDINRELTRLFSLLMVYLLVMQLKDKLHPEKIISLLFLSLILPVTVALMQVLLPISLLPTPLWPLGERIRGTLGHPNGLVTYLLLFIALTCWKLMRTRRRWRWILLLGLLAFLFVGSKALFGLTMFSVFVVVFIAPRANLPNLIGGVVLVVLTLALFSSTPFGQQRLSSVLSTPLFDPNFDVSRAVLTANWDFNSFNWRLAQWTFLLQAWQNSRIFGYGQGTSVYLSEYHLYAHNDYVRALVEGGIVGLIAFLVFLGAQFLRLVQLVWCAPRGSAHRDFCLTLLALFLSIPVAMLTENMWSQTTFFFYWWTLFAIAGWNWEQLPPRNSPLPISRLSQTP